MRLMRNGIARSTNVPLTWGFVTIRRVLHKPQYSVPYTVESVPDSVILTRSAALARLGSALADEIRARILLALREAPAVPSDLASALEVSR